MQMNYFYAAGVDGIALAIVEQSARDVGKEKQRPDALRFFYGKWYRHICECFGLYGCLPANVSALDVLQQAVIDFHNRADPYNRAKAQVFFNSIHFQDLRLLAQKERRNGRLTRH